MNQTRRLTRALWTMSALCLTAALAVVACGAPQVAPLPDGSCPRAPLPLTSGLYLELATGASNGRLPRLTVQQWPWASHPHHTAPDMLMKLDRRAKTLTLSYKRDGEAFVERWAIGQKKDHPRAMLTPGDR